MRNPRAAKVLELIFYIVIVAAIIIFWAVQRGNDDSPFSVIEPDITVTFEGEVGQ